MTFAIILAGGEGTRFWPLSRQSEPKQFLKVYSDKPMIEETIRRFIRLLPQKNIYLASSFVHEKKIREYARKLKLSSNNILLEPSPKNTLPPIAVISKIIHDTSKDAVIIVAPSDHFVKDQSEFLKAIRMAVAVAAKGYIVTLGITPRRPETGYGYIKVKTKPKTNAEIGSGVYLIDRFIEKPILSKAKKFVKEGNYYWNSGIFVFRADVMLQEIKGSVPQVYEIVKSAGSLKLLIGHWHEFPSISVDYAIMEKAHNIALIPAGFGWSDLGSWQAMGEIMKKDRHGNILKGNCVDLGSKNTLVWANKRLVATLGLKDIVVVDTKDALLVCSKDKTQDVKRLVQILKQGKFKGKI